MEEHPVPHNVLEIEFKLFGAFSVRQFLRIMAGGAVALVVYVLNLPSILSVPLIIMALGIGVASALINNFDAQANTIVSAILVSPRYVWRRDPVAPEFLLRDYQSKIDRDQKLKSAKNKVKVSEIELDQLLKTRRERREGTSTLSTNQNSGSNQRVETNKPSSVNANDWLEMHHGDTPPENFAKFYQDSFAVNPNSSNNSLKTVQEDTQTSQVNNATEQASNVTTTPEINEPKQNKLDELTEQLGKLKNQLNAAQKERKGKLQIDAITAQINSVYRDIKELETEMNSSHTKPTSDIKMVGQHIFGYVVDKKENPIPDVSIIIKDPTNRLVSEIKTDKNGTFETLDVIAPGEYIVSLNKKGHRFNQYKIPVGMEELPAYKFREI